MMTMVSREPPSFRNAQERMATRHTIRHVDDTSARLAPAYSMLVIYMAL